MGIQVASAADRFLGVHRMKWRGPKSSRMQQERDLATVKHESQIIFWRDIEKRQE